MVPGPKFKNLRWYKSLECRQNQRCYWSTCKRRWIEFCFEKR